MTISEAAARVMQLCQQNGRMPETLPISRSEAISLTDEWRQTIPLEHQERARACVARFFCGEETLQIMGAKVLIVE